MNSPLFFSRFYALLTSLWQRITHTTPFVIVIARGNAYIRGLSYSILEAWKQLFPPPKANLTVQEVIAELRGYNKNKLIQILTNVIADKNKLVPICDNKKEIKRDWSKKELIAAIVGELTNRVKPQAVNQDKLQIMEQEKVKIGENIA